MHVCVFLYEYICMYMYVYILYVCVYEYVSGDFSKTAREAQLHIKCKKLNGQIYTVNINISLP